MNYRNNSAKNLLHSTLNFPQSPTYYPPKQTCSAHFIDNTTASLEDDYQVQVETIISSINKVGPHISSVSQKTIDRFEQTITNFYNQFIVPLRSNLGLRRQISTPQLQPFQKQKKVPNPSSSQQLKDLEMQIQTLKLQKLKIQLQQKEDNLRKQNIFQLKQMQAKYMNRDKPLDIHSYLAKFLKEMIQKVQKAVTVQDMLPHIRDIYREIWKMEKENTRIGSLLKEYCAEVENVIGCDEEEQEA